MSKKKQPSIMVVSIAGFPSIKGGVNTMVKILANETNRHFKSIIFTPGEWNQKDLVTSQINNITNYSLRLRVPSFKNNALKDLIGSIIEFPCTLLKLHNITKTEKINIIHIQTVAPYHIYFYLLKLIGGPKYIITFRGSEVITYRDKNWFNRFLIHLSVKGAEKVFANSNRLAISAKINFPFLKSIPTIYNGIKLPDISINKLSSNERNIYKKIPSSFFVSVGSFDFVKGHDILIEAWKHVITQKPNSKLVLVGDGDYRKQYEHLAHKYNCEESIIFIGEVSNQLSLTIINDAIALVLPSRHEGFGNVIIEAGSLKTPVIATETGGIPEIITNNYSGLLVPKEDKNALAKAIIDLSSNKNLRESLAINLYSTVLKKFTSTIMVEKYINEYKKLL
jgi:glycosyltransferase involved in cell wall biosynthesis